MMLARRQVLTGGGAFLATLACHRQPAISAGHVELVMEGRPDGSHVWFTPRGLRIPPGQILTWTNKDPGNSHTVTAYHPSIGRVLRIPEGAEPFDSGYLLPGESFSVTLTVEGVYDYYCVPHEHAGMVGRIVVGNPPATDAPTETDDPGLEPVPQAALEQFPSIAEIVAKGRIEQG